MAYGDGTELSKFESAMEAIGLAWWWMELPSGATFFSPNKARMLGYNPKDFYHYKQFTDIVHPDDYKKIMKDMQDHLDGITPLYQTSYRIKHADGHYATFFDKGKIVGRQGEDTYVAGFVFDAAEFAAGMPAAAPIA